MPNSSSQRKLLLIFTFILLGMAVTPATAQESSQAISMEITPAYQGYFKYGEWLPVWVILENDGLDLEGEVQVKIVRDFEQVTFAVPVSLPAGARKRTPVYVLPNNFTHELKVEFLAEGETILAENVMVYPQPNINFIIGVTANQRGALTLVPGIQLPGGRLPVPVDISLNEIPDRPETLRSLDCLILNDIDTSGLTPDQVNALIGWVQQGGRLIIGGGAGAIRTTAGFSTEILPVVPDDLTDLENVDALEFFANTTQVRVPGPFVIAIGEKQAGQTLVEQDGFPLVQEIKLGEGYITFVSLDLTTSPFDAWTGTTAFWETIITPGAAYPNWMPPDMSPRQMAANPIGNALANIPSLDLPSARGITILLGIYIFLVGPVNYALLRWRKKLHWGWVTIPLITLVFSAMSFGLGYAKRGTDLILNKIAIIQAQPDGATQVSSYMGLFSPANQSYEIEVPGKNLLSPISSFYNPWMSSVPQGGSNSNLTFVQSNPSRVRGLTVNQWSMQSFMTESTSDEIGQISADLFLEDQQLVGSVTNLTGYDLKDVVLILKPNFVRLGNIEARETTDVDLELSPGEMHGTTMSWKIFETDFSPSMMGAPSREQEFKRMVLEAVLDQQSYYGTHVTPGGSRSATELSTSTEVTLIGWMDDAPPDVRINGQIPQESATALYKTQLTFQIPESGEIAIPPGLIPGLVAEMPITGGTCGVENTSIWIEKGEAILEFILPPEFSEIEIDNLQFLIQAEGGWGNSPEIAIYNWETTTWQPVENSILGINTFSEPADSISTEGLVRFRIGIENQDFRGGNCFYASLGLEGNH